MFLFRYQVRAISCIYTLVDLLEQTTRKRTVSNVEPSIQVSARTMYLSFKMALFSKGILACMN